MKPDREAPDCIGDIESRVDGGDDDDDDECSFSI